MVKLAVLRNTAKFLPSSFRTLAKRVLFRNRHWAHPALKRYGTIQDLYYWVADGEKDTLLVLQNYYTALYPALDTQTEGTISLFDQRGDPLVKKTFSLPHGGAAKFRASSLLQALPAAPEDRFGTLEVNLAIPRDVLSHIQDIKSFYFWDRFYICYSNSQGQTCFVHGVDKTHIFRDGDSESTDWYGAPGNHEWAPEIPVNIGDYLKFSVIMINRTPRSTNVTLRLHDSEDNLLAWEAQIPPRGVHRFELDQENTAGLNPVEMRMRVEGMATRFGRPVVFKEFTNGAISAMHC